MKLGLKPFIVLFLIMVIGLSMKQFFGDYIMENFANGSGRRGYGITGYGTDLSAEQMKYIPVNDKIGNMGYAGKQFLNIAMPPASYNRNINDDSASHYSFGLSY